MVKCYLHAYNYADKTFDVVYNMNSAGASEHLLMEIEQVVVIDTANDVLTYVNRLPHVFKNGAKVYFIKC